MNAAFMCFYVFPWNLEVKKKKSVVKQISLINHFLQNKYWTEKGKNGPVMYTFL